MNLAQCNYRICEYEKGSHGMLPRLLTKSIPLGSLQTMQKPMVSLYLVGCLISTITVSCFYPLIQLRLLFIGSMLHALKILSKWWVKWFVALATVNFADYGKKLFLIFEPCPQQKISVMCVRKMQPSSCSPLTVLRMRRGKYYHEHKCTLNVRKSKDATMGASPRKQGWYAKQPSNILHLQFWPCSTSTLS